MLIAIKAPNLLQAKGLNLRDDVVGGDTSWTKTG